MKKTKLCLRLILVVCVALLMLSMFGCADLTKAVKRAVSGARGAQFSGVPTVSDNKAIIVVYRPNNVFLSGTYPFIYIDGVKKAALYNNGYLMYRVSPGIHSVEAKGPFKHWDARMRKLKLAVKLDVEAGHIYYIRLNFFLPPKMWGEGVVIIVYRMDRFFLNGPYPFIYIDDVKKAVLYNGGYHVYRRPLGIYSVDIKAPFRKTEHKHKLDATKKGFFYIWYVWLNPRKIGETLLQGETLPQGEILPQGGPVPLGTFWLVAPERALKELKSLRLSE